MELQATSSNVWNHSPQNILTLCVQEEEYIFFQN